MPLRLPRRRMWRAAIYLAAVVLVLLAADLILVEHRRTIHPGYDTTRILSPALPDGSIDYLLAIDEHFGKDLTPQNNAAVPLLQALGRGALPRNQPVDGITERVGMPHLPDRGDYFVPFAEFVNHRPGVDAEPDPMDEAHPLAWPVKPSEVTLKWLKSVDGPLDRVEWATQRPRFWIPFYGGYRPQTLLEILLPHVRPMQDCGRALLLRGAMRLDAGDAKGFARDVMAVHRLARLIDQAPTLVERRVAKEMETAACRIDRAAASSGKLPSKQAQSLAEELAALPELSSPADGLDWAERYMVLDTMQTTARAGQYRAAQLFGGIINGGFVPPALFRFFPMPYEQSMREANHCYDGALAALRQPTHAQRAAALALMERDILDELGRTNIVPLLLSGRWPLRYFMPAIRSQADRWEVARTQTRLTQLALALAAYKADRGSYAQSLAELSPQYLRAIPEDPFADKPFIYAPRADRFTLYSVGPNMTDDGGNATSPGDDIPASW